MSIPINTAKLADQPRVHSPSARKRDFQLTDCKVWHVELAQLGLLRI